MSIQIFKHISIGGISKDKLIEKLIDKGIQFNQYAHVLFDDSNFIVSTEIENVDLVKISLFDLGLSEQSSYDKIVDEAQKIELKQCPLCLGAFLRPEYLDQEEGPYLTIASEKMVKDVKYPNGFYIRHIDNIFWLRGYYASDDYKWPLNSEFVFIK